MPDLSFRVDGVDVVEFAAAPTLAIKLRITNANPDELIQTVALRCQIQIETTRRHYAPDEQKRMLDLFGEPERWSHTLRTMLWTHASVIVSPFSGETVVDLPVPCTFDFNVAATKYFAALNEGEVPLDLLFSGTVFYESETAGLQVEQIPWNCEARFRLPIDIWRTMMGVYYPNSAWLRLRKDVFDKLSDYKMRNAIPTWEQTLQQLLNESEEAGASDREDDVINLEDQVRA